MANITSVIRYISDSEVGHLEVSMNRLRRKDMQRVMGSLEMTINDKGNVEIDLGSPDKMIKLVDIMAGFLADYIVRIESDITIDNEKLTVEGLLDNSALWSELTSICLYQFKESGTINEEEVKNSDEPKQESSAD